MSDQISLYAESIVGFARADGELAELTSELPRVADAVAASEELSSALTDSSVPVARRQQIIEDVLGATVSGTTIGVLSLIVATGHAGELGEIAAAVLRHEASARGEEVAEVRSAVSLTQDQLDRLSTALQAQTGRPVTVRNIVDPTVLGGVVTQIGDSVLDGTVRTRLNQLREAF